MSKRILMIIAPEQFRDEELAVPRRLLQAEGWTVDVASTRAGVAPGMLGASEAVTLTVDAVNPDDYAALVVVGGMGSPEHLWHNPRLHALVHALNVAGKVVSAICLSGAVLAKAGVLRGRKATVWEMPESLAALREGGCDYTGEPVTEDGNIITANGPEAAEAFGRALIARIKAPVGV